MRPLCLLALLSSLASAQGFELERLVLNPGGTQTWLAQTGDGLAQRQLRVALLGHYQHRPLVYTVDGVVVGAPVQGRVTAHLVAAYGVFDQLEVGLQLPVVLAQFGDDLSSFGLAPVQGTALGAPWLSLRSTLLREREGRPVDLAISAQYAVPLGSALALTREPAVHAAFRLGLGRTVEFLRIGAELAADVRGAQVLSPGSARAVDTVGSSFEGALALSTVGLPVQAELTARLSVPFVAAPVSVEVLAALRAKLGQQLEVSLLGGPGIGKTPGTPAFRVLAGFAWTPDFSTPAAE